MSGKIIEIEFEIRKKRVKNPDLRYDFFKVPLLKGKSGTFKTQKRHFYWMKVPLSLLKNTSFGRILRAFSCTLFRKSFIKPWNIGIYNCTRNFTCTRANDFIFQTIKSEGVNENQKESKKPCFLSLWLLAIKSSSY